MTETVLAVDPGRQKCGLAVGRPGQMMARRVVPTGDLPQAVREWVRAHGVTRIIVGGGTGSQAVRAALAATAELPPVEMVEEEGTTLGARRRYFRDHPPRGWRRFVPLSLQVPPEDYDDYVAELLLDRSVGLSGGKAPK